MNGGPHPRDRLSQQLPESADNCCHDFPVWHCEGCSLVAETVKFEQRKRAGAPFRARPHLRLECPGFVTRYTARFTLETCTP